MVSSKPFVMNVGVLGGINYFTEVIASEFPRLQDRDETPVRGESAPYGIDVKLNLSRRIKFQYALLIESENYPYMSNRHDKYGGNDITSKSQYLNQKICILFKINPRPDKNTYFSFGTIHSYNLGTNYRYHYVFSYPYNPRIDSLFTYTSKRFQLYKWAINIAFSRETLIKNSPVSIFREISYTTVPMKIYEKKIPSFDTDKIGIAIGFAYNFGIAERKTKSRD